ncbi:MAG: hypothetical protein DHS20C15_06630 [Planctomycetota bacterium]|nr:MAG: hypothetical protein DHS20C15_06630 [Planctomycetota bacterium]
MIVAGGLVILSMILVLVATSPGELDSEPANGSSPSLTDAALLPAAESASSPVSSRAASAEALQRLDPPEPARVLRVRVYELKQGRRGAQSPGIEGALVTGGFARSMKEHLPALDTARTGTDGRCELRLPLAVLEAERGAGNGAYWVRAEFPGFIPSTVTFGFPDRSDEAFDTSCGLTAGAEIDVHVFGPDGAPAQADVQLVPATTDLSRLGSGRRTDADGRARLKVTRHGELAVLARGLGAQTLGERTLSWDTPYHLGAGFSPRFEVDFASPPEGPVEVHLPARAMLLGRLVDEHGEPAAGVHLSARAVSLAPRDGSALAADRPWSSVRLRDSTLLSRGETLTRNDGRFEFGGLLPGNYEIWAAPSRSWDETSRRLGERSFATDGTRHELVLSRPHLMIRVLDEWGATLTEPDAYYEIGSAGAWHESPEMPRLMVLRDPSAGDEEPLFGPRPIEPGLFVCEVEAPADYLVGWLARDRPWRPVHVTVPADATRVDVELRVAAARAPATLELRAVDATGALLSSGLSVSLIDSETDVALIETTDAWDADSWPLAFQLAPGPLRVRVAGAWVTGRHGFRARPEVGSAQRDVMLVSGAVHEVELEPGSGAHLRVAAQGAPNAADREAGSTQGFIGSDEEAPRDREFWSSVASIELVKANGHRQAVQFDVTGYAPRFGRFALRHVHGALLGRTLLSQSLPAGRFTLVATLPGGRELRREVELFDSATTDVTLDFR